MPGGKCILLFTLLISAAVVQAEEIERRLYVVAPGIRDYPEWGGAGVLVFDIDHDHRFLKRIPIPTHSDLKKPLNVKGVCADAATARLFFTTLEDVYCLDLKSEKVLWQVKPVGGCDRLSVTTDGKSLYVPALEKDHWNILDAATGATVKTLSAPPGEKWGSHNTLAGPLGKRVYLAGRFNHTLRIADPATMEITATCGPFTDNVRPFTVNAAETRVYANIDSLLGFEIGDLETGKLLARVEVPDFKKGAVKRHGCPCHGVGLTPDEKELWLCDGANQSVHIFDNTVQPPKYVSTIKVFDDPGWITFSLDGAYAYPSTL